MEYNKKQLSELEYLITAAAIEVHKHLGPGLLERVYHTCIASELNARGLSFISEMNVPLIYKGQNLDVDLRCDFFVEGIIALELKSVEYHLPIFEAQLLTYMRLLESPKGLLINFNCRNIVKEGKKSFVNSLYSELIS
jgi:GxxExxY protein